TELTGITFAAKIDCRQAVSSLRSVPEPAAWRYDLVNTFEKLDRLSWSGTLFESTLAVSWRDRKTNGLTSLLTLIHQWQGEREGSELYTAIDRDDFDAFKIAMESAAAHLLDPESYATPLHFAARKGHVDMVRYILEKGIDVDARDSSGRTPLYAACWSGQPNVVQALLEQNASVDVANANGATPVMVASRIGHAEIVEILLNAGAKLNATDQHGQGLLEYAAAGGREAVILLLQERNATVRRPLHLAAGTGDLEKLKILLAAGREVDEKDGGGGTALLFAASAGKWKALNLLLGEGADPLATDDLGLTLIHAATVSGNEKVLQQVLELHSQTNARHKQHGSTPLDWAIAKKDQVLTEMLRAKGGKTSWELGAAQ
ncbi:MAG: ankyrin repeat domain-containing protein, partial [Opitutales bacterium]